MKRLLVVCYLLIISLTIFCQQQPALPDGKVPHSEHSFGEFTLSGSPDILFNTPNGVQLAGGLKISTFVSKKFSFDSDLAIGWDYFHMGPGIIGIPLWLLFLESGVTVGDEGMTSSELLVYAIFIVLSVEHFSYHIPVKPTVELSPYVSLLRFKYAYKHNDYMNPDYAGSQFSFAFGIQVDKYIKRFVVSPYAEVNVGYSDHIPGYNIGVYCGYNFKNKR